MRTTGIVLLLLVAGSSAVCAEYRNSSAYTVPPEQKQDAGSGVPGCHGWRPDLVSGIQEEVVVTE
jgi:hypothetical protein